MSCSWCDTPYTWDGARFDLRTEITPTDLDTVLSRLAPGLVVLTGGEPLLHQRAPAWAAMLDRLRAAGREIHVETNGTLAPTGVTCDAVGTFVVSPKLANAGAHRGGQRPDLHPDWPGLSWRVDAHLKVVCAGSADVRQAADLAQRVGWHPGRVWVMPLGATRDELAVSWPAVVQAAADLGLNATHRLHVLAWGDERGR